MASPPKWFPNSWITGAVSACLFGTVIFSAIIAQDPASWKMETLLLKNGARIEGLLLEETKTGFRFRQVIRKSGSPTITGTEVYSRAEVASIERLNETEKTELTRKLDEFDKQRQLFLASLRQLDLASPRSSIEGLKLKPVTWPENTSHSGWAFESQYFDLRTDLREPLAALMALQLEEVFRACTRVIPPRIDGKPTRIQVWAERDRYLEAISRKNASLAHPAVFDPLANRILAGTELARLESESAEIRKHHSSQSALLSKRESEISKAMGGRIPAEYQEQFTKSRREIRDAESRNDQTIRQARQNLLQVLNHEAIHAYLINWVFPANTYSLPRWLNEGLAQVFETAFVEAGELRANWPDQKRLAAVRALIAQNRFPSLKRTLAGAPDHFLAMAEPNPEDRETSREAYLSSWIVTYYLVFEKRLLPGPKLDDYLKALANAADPVAAFEQWTGEPLARFEEGIRIWITKLRPDGTTVQEDVSPVKPAK